MSFLTTLGRMFVPGPEEFRTLQTEFASFEDQLAAIRAAQAQPRPWRASSVDEALAVPAIFGAVTLIASQMGTLSMEAYRNDQKLRAQDRPRLIIRPNPRTTPYAFFFLSAFYKATRGERWWWVPTRDTDGVATSLFPVPPWEVIVEANDRDRLNPTIRWLNRVMPNGDMIQDIWFPDASGLRGVGPLQKAGAAVSVAVEANAWAANFFSGSFPSLIGTTTADYDELDLKALDAQWAEKPNNLPRWMTNGLTLSETPFNAEKAQLNDSRHFQVGEVARMFNVPGPLIEYQMSGQSLTYRNEADIWLDFKQRCLGPIIAEPMEQQLSDLLTRSTTARFNYDQLLRADIKTRYESYKIGVDAGFLSSEEVRQQEGLAPGAVDFAPVPFAPPQADPGAIPMQLNRSLTDAHCPKCHRLVGRYSGSLEVKCPRCGAMVAA